jgi:ribosomal protein S18 acetylase RimI-like enzyme
MALVVRRVKVADLSALEVLEQENLRRFPGRPRWPETFRQLVETTLSEEPEGLLVADFDGRTIGAAVVRQRGAHPLTGTPCGRLEALTVAPGWRNQGVSERLMKEAEAYLKAHGCQTIVVNLPVDAGADGELYKQAGFTVAGWELERRL